MKFNPSFWAILILFLGLEAKPASAYQSVVLAWNSSPDPTVAGYFIYYGSSSGNYLNKLDAGMKTTSEISDLADSSSNYFVITAYNGSGIESAPSNEAMFLTPSSDGLQLQPIGNTCVNLLQTMVIDNAFLNPNNLSGTFAFSLDPGAPAGMTINSQTGVISWTPNIQQAGSTNEVTVRISDSSVPPFTDAQTFTVAVPDAAQLNLASGVIALGTAGIVSATLNCSGCLSNISFELKAPSGWVDSLSFQSPLANAFVTQTEIGPADLMIELQITNGNYLRGSNVIGQICIHTTPTQTSSLGGMITANFAAMDPEGLPMATVPGADSELVFVGRDSLLEARLANGSRELVLYGPIGGNYVVESTSNFANPSVWNPEFTVQMTNLSQVFQNITNDGVNKFYRAQRF